MILYMNAIQQVIPSFTQIHQYNDQHIMFKCTIRDILSANIVNWEYNRPPDLVRCNEIATYIYAKRPELDWLFYITYLEHGQENMLSMVDGIHRLTALRIIHSENIKPVDFITPSRFGHGGNAEWLYDKYILVSLRLNPSAGETIDLFQTLNKSNPVPELYIRNTDQDKRIIIEEFVQDWMKKYKSHFSANVKPNIPNINRDRFIEILDIVYTKCKITKLTQNRLAEKIGEMNQYIMVNLPAKCKEKPIEKCRKTGCYLFLVSRDFLEDLI